MGFGSGVLLAVLTLELLTESLEHGSIAAPALGFILGATLFSTINWRLEQRGAADRKRCGACVAQPTEAKHPAAAPPSRSVPSSMAFPSPSPSA
jgi:ZIP family zinc transporter